MISHEGVQGYEMTQQFSDEFCNALLAWRHFYNVEGRPGSIRVFMYPGWVCNSRVGTRITGAVNVAH